MRKMLLYTLGVLSGLVALLVVGLMVRPSMYPAPESAASKPIERIDAPEGVPAPVARWFGREYPQGLPKADSITMRGRGVFRMGPVNVPIRHRNEYRPGEGFYRQMDLTLFGVTVARGRDVCIDEHGLMDTPVGDFRGDKIDQGANMAHWLEVLSVPGTLMSTPGVRWEPVDENHARLVFPFRGGSDSLVIGFDPKTTAPITAEAKRWRNTGDTEKADWFVEMKGRKVIGGLPTATRIDVTWLADGKPWSTFEIEDVIVNGDVPDYDEAAAAERKNIAGK